MAVTVYEVGKLEALSAMNQKFGRMILLDSFGDPLTTASVAEIDSTTYSIATYGNAGSDTLTLGANVDFNISAGGQTAAKIRITTDSVDTPSEASIIDIDLTTSVTFEASGTFSLTASTITIA